VCLDCGCHEPNNGHQDPRHITLHDLQQAAAASHCSTQEAAQRILDEVTRALHTRMLGQCQCAVCLRIGR